MAIKSNALAENKAAILAEDGGTIYATLQMRHGKESEMDESKFVPAEIGVATDTKKAVIAFGPGDTKEFAFKDDIPDQDYNNLENKPSIGGVELSGDKSLEQLGIQPKGEYITKIPAEYVTDTELTKKLKSYPTKEEQAADAEKVGARLHEIDAVKLRGPVETVNGEILQIENPAEQPPVGMRVYGKAEQNTTTGAQLLNAPDKTNKIFGVTMSVSGGIASFSGTLSSNNATFWFIGSYNGVDVVMTLPAGKYYLQNCSMQTLGNSALKTGAITSETEIQITGVAYTYTDSSPKTIYPMINAGSKALPWEPYTGGQPSPSPEYLQEIEMSGKSGKIGLTISDGQEKEQVLNISAPNGLPGLPVDSGGNYTDENGQQWICDSVEFYSDGTGKKIQRLKRASGLAFKKVSYGIQEESYLYETYLSDLSENGYPPCLCTGLKYDKKILDNNLNGMYAYPKSIRARFKDSKNEQEDIEKLKTFEFLYALQTPIETDLSSEEIAAYRALKLNNPVTNVFTAESLMPGIAVDYVPETERYIEKSINDNTQKAPAIVEKASGEMLNVTDSSDLGLKGLKVLGKSQQVTTTGAQLFDASKLPTKSANGATVTNNGDGSFTISGSGTLSGEFRQAYDLNHEESVRLLKKGFLNLRANKTEPYVSIVIYFNESQKELNTTSKEETRLEILENEINNESFHIKVQFYGRIGKEIVSGIVKPMLYQDGDGTWEPYTGEKPSPSPEYPQEIKIPGSDGEIGVKVTGAQLLDFRKAKGNENAEGVAYTVLENGSVLRKGTATGEAGNCWFLGDYEIIPSENTTIMTLEAGKTYYIKDCVVYSNTKVLDTGIINISIEEYPDGFKVTGVRNEKQNIKNTYNDIIYPMIAESSTPLPWEPYKLQSLTLSTPNGLPGIPVDSGGNYTDESGQQWICDEVDFERGKYIQRVIQKENLTFTKNGDYTVEGSELYFCSVPEFSKTGNVAYIGTGMSTHMRYTNTVLDKNEVGFYIGYGGIWARIKDVGDLDTFNEKLQDAVFYFTYTNMSPIEIDLTEEQLKSYRSLYTNYSTTNVFTDSDPQVGLGMEYVADTKSYIDKKFEELQKALVNTNTQIINKVMEDIEHV